LRGGHNAGRGEHLLSKYIAASLPAGRKTRRTRPHRLARPRATSSYRDARGMRSLAGQARRSCQTWYSALGHVVHVFRLLPAPVETTLVAPALTAFRSIVGCNGRRRFEV
jgi:hypothetical protein